MLQLNNHEKQPTLREQVRKLCEPLNNTLDATDNGHIIFSLEGKRYQIQNKESGAHIGFISVIVEDENNPKENYSIMNFYSGLNGRDPKVIYIAKFGDFVPGTTDTWTTIIGQKNDYGAVVAAGELDYEAVEDYIKGILSKREQSQELAKSKIEGTSSVLSDMAAEMFGP